MSAPDWPETSWARLVSTAIEHEAVARQMRTVADEVRCAASDSGGARCTADAMPPHAHRVAAADLPRGERP